MFQVEMSILSGQVALLHTIIQGLMFFPFVALLSLGCCLMEEAGSLWAPAGGNGREDERLIHTSLSVGERGW